MIINCPACKTGFNLPDKHINAKGAKLRCSKCGHVFRVRRKTPDVDIDFYYKPEDEKANLESGALVPEGADPMVADAASSNRTHFGVPTSKEEGGQEALEEPVSSQTSLGAPAKDAAASMDELPVAKPVPSLSSRLGSSESASNPLSALPPASSAAPAEPASAGVDLFADESILPGVNAPDPFAGAFGDDKDEQIGLDDFHEYSEAIDTEDKAPEPEPILTPGSPGMAGFSATTTPEPEPIREAKPEPSVQPAQNLFGGEPVAEKEEPPARSASGWQQAGGLGRSGSNMFGDASDMVDPSFGQDGPSFDPNRGVVSPSAPAPAAQPAPVAPQPRQQAPAPQQPASTGPRPAKDSAQWSNNLDKIETEPHKIGGGGLQKVANLILIVLVVIVGFFGLLATLNGGMLDFKQFGSMLEVAFSGAEYKPRPEWLPKEVPKPQAVPEAPLRTESVWAQSVQITRKNKVLVVRGFLRNFDQQEYVDVKLRGIILNDKEKIIGEAETVLGSTLPNAELKKLTSADDIAELIPETATPLKVAGSEPFAIVFDSIPKAYTEGETVYFRVDVTNKVGKQDLLNKN